MTVLEHLEELRRVLIISLISWAVGTIIGFAISGFVLEILLQPVRAVIGGQHIVYFTGPIDKFFLYFKVGIFTGFILSSPVILWQVWTFVAPGLHRNERRFAVGFVASAVGLFVAGILFAFFAMPIALRFLTGFGSSDIQYFPLADRYINFVLIVIAIFGVTFELPVVAYFLSRVGLIDHRFLIRHIRYAVVGIAILAAVLTPPDLVSQALFMVPLSLIYGVSIGVAYLGSRKSGS